MRTAGALVSAGHLACGLTGWLAFDLPGAMLLFGLCAALSLALALIASPPPWWPHFERAFRAHAARQRTRA
jgi:hypothetical protein